MARPAPSPPRESAGDPVEELTGFRSRSTAGSDPAPAHAGLLADLRPEHEAQLREWTSPVDLLVVNLYPFVQTVSFGASPEVIEQIDIGGPAMVRAAATNHANVAVVVDQPLRVVLGQIRAGASILQERN